MTPSAVAERIVGGLSLTPSDRVLEPSMGDGAFLVPLIERFMRLRTEPADERLHRVLTENVYGAELDKKLYERCLARICRRWGELPETHNLVCGDFFRCAFGRADFALRPHAQRHIKVDAFDYVVGNPPFGGRLDPELEDFLDELYGFRGGEKIKKETYSFFIVRSLDLLRPGGSLTFICSDTFLTIRTMRGLRRLLMTHGTVNVHSLNDEFEETSYPMVVLDFVRSGRSEAVYVDGAEVTRDIMRLTGNFSWRISPELAPYFRGPSLGDYFVATSGMTIGKNEYFLRRVENGHISEPYEFQFFDDPITLRGELERARLGKLSDRQIQKVQGLESTGATRRNVRVTKRQEPVEVRLPHPDYCNYNKASSEIVYSPPSHVVYWKDDGDAVLTFKANGNWYLRGVGGAKHFGREGLTWQLISENLNVRYLPPGYILDSGAPCAFPRPGTDADELYFVLAWTLTPLCRRLLKEVINHTKNIQSKDFERLPYPYWVSSDDKLRVIELAKQLVERAMQGARVTRDCEELMRTASLFAETQRLSQSHHTSEEQLRLFDKKGLTLR